MVETVQVSTGTQIIDLNSGELTREGFLIFQYLSDVLPSFNAHIVLEATTSAIGHMTVAGAVADASPSTVSVDSADVAAAPVAYDQAFTDTIVTLINENKADTNTIVTDLNNVVTQLNALITSLETAGTITT